MPLGKDGGGYRDDVDWTADEELVQEVLESLMRVQPKVRAEDASLVAKLADLLERAGPQFIVAARRHVAATENDKNFRLNLLKKPNAWSKSNSNECTIASPRSYNEAVLAISMSR